MEKVYLKSFKLMQSTKDNFKMTKNVEMVNIYNGMGQFIREIFKMI